MPPRCPAVAALGLFISDCEVAIEALGSSCSADTSGQRELEQCEGGQRIIILVFLQAGDMARLMCHKAVAIWQDIAKTPPRHRYEQVPTRRAERIGVRA